MFLKTQAIVLLLILPFFSKINAQSLSKEEPEWLYVTKGEDNKVYILSECVSKQGNEIKVWTKWVYTKPHKYDGKIYTDFYYKHLAIWDTQSNKYKNLYNVYYSGSKVIDSYTFEEEEWKYIIPDTIGESIMQMTAKLFN